MKGDSRFNSLITRVVFFARSEEEKMARKTDRDQKKARAGGAASAKPRRAPAGKGGAAIGRTVGLPFGGVAPRKRKAKSSDNKRIANKSPR